MPTTSLSTTTLPYYQREWVDVETSLYDKSCFEVSEKMIRLLRHDLSVLRGDHGAVEFRILAQLFHSKVTSSQQWSIRAWLNYLQKEEDLRRYFSIARQPVTTDDFAEQVYRGGTSHDSRWQRRREREACGVLYGRASNVHQSLSGKGLRRDTAQNCSSVQKQSETTSNYSKLL